ncbi:VanZ family protein [Echinicola strongylocentroti]|uniref:VanZ family protein n=1 Tax=Echinicola strongylocentroti TaxID=1795355 RepID=A0A2Z4IG15_9BACT|nr:VanZ family protein [Echinicola strongylocentroti]AWW29393.1 VanZ family protein [Echinicola strongylocentroti]
MESFQAIYCRLKHTLNWLVNKPKQVSERLLPALIWLAILLWLILSPGEKLPDVSKTPGMDKIGHFGLFMGLLFTWNRVWNHTTRPLNKKHFITNYLVLGVFFAILVEWIQQLVPNRAFDLLDIAANLLGSAVGTICFYILYKKKSKLV